MDNEMKKLKVAIVGCGRVSVMHFGSCKLLSDMCELVACCDVKPDRADACAEKYGIRAYTDYKEMIKNEQLDAVHLCLPHYIHSSVAREFFAHGINVLCEKPMDISYEAALGAVEAAEKAGVLYGIVSQCRYNNAVRFVRSRLAEGRLGKILSATSTLTWSRSDDYYSESDWKGTWDKEGGGVIIDQAIHSIDLVNWLIDEEIKDISCSMANRGHKRVFVEDTCDGLITYASGIRYGFYAMNNNATDEPIEIKLFCENGKVRFSYNDAYIDYSDGTHGEAHKESDDTSFDGAKEYWGEVHVKQIRQFYAAVRGLEPLEISGREALKTHALIMRLYELGGMRKKYWEEQK